jgi:hypothetical protein|tara:strand:+ start:2577 stop:2810 length:234 start_codon:yes stop_codon:yes gene_type:complete
MAKTETQYLSGLQSFLQDEDFDELVARTKFRFFEDWQHSQSPADRERIFAKLETFEELCNALRAAGDSIAFEKQKDN